MTEQGTPILQMSGINTYYDQIHILQDVALEVRSGELVCLLGGNASGKSTTLKTILGIVIARSGSVVFKGEDVTNKPTSYRIAKGMAVVPENRRIFSDMTVDENLMMGAYKRTDRENLPEDRARVFDLFPRLYERLDQLGGTLSGGEQQMLAMGRALMSRPNLILMDEPSMGLAPVLVEKNFEIIEEVNNQGTTIFMVEQNANMALSIADRGYVVQTGRIVLNDSAERLLTDDKLRTAYLGRASH
ncbi:MAG: ABC transporter ATP-binding protein [Chloroflexota bacterium]